MKLIKLIKQMQPLNNTHSKVTGVYLAQDRVGRVVCGSVLPRRPKTATKGVPAIAVALLEAGIDYR